METKSHRRADPALAAVCAFLILAPGSANWPRERDFQPIEELHGLTTVRVDVDGLPNPIGEVVVSQESLRRSVEASLREFGLTVSAEAAAPATLRITVLAPQFDETYFYTIHVRLSEPCSPQREPDIVVPWCVTWSAFPRIGTFAPGKEDTLSNVVLQAVAQFGLQWAIENNKNRKP